MAELAAKDKICLGRRNANHINAHVPTGVSWNKVDADMVLTRFDHCDFDLVHCERADARKVNEVFSGEITNSIHLLGLVAGIGPPAEGKRIGSSTAPKLVRAR